MGWYARTGASRTLLEFAVDLGWNCFAKEMYSPLPFETRRLLYWLCFAKGGYSLFVSGLQWMWMWSILQKGCAPLSKADNCRVPLFHYFAVNLHNRLNCLKGGIGVSRILSSYSMAYWNLMAASLIEIGQNSFFVSPVKLWNWRQKTWIFQHYWFVRGGNTSQSDARFGNL